MSKHFSALPLHRFTTGAMRTRSKKTMNDALFSLRKGAGLLIAFEGPDGSGKTTQRKLFKSWLRSMKEDVVVTKWSSSPRFKHIIKERKAARTLDPATYASLHAADFWCRYETVIEPALAQGKIVLADRYVFTGIARDTARGINPSWSAQLYAGVRQPDMVFYFDAPVQVCAQRISASREIKFYESGQDITGLPDAFESYLRFTASVISEYKRLHNEFGFEIVDAEKPIYKQHEWIREAYLAHCDRTPITVPYARQLAAVLS
jgi:dTMP kinase